MTHHASRLSLHPCIPFILWILAAFAAFARPALAAWPNGGSPVGTASGTQGTGGILVGSTVCSDGDGGLICAYQDGAEIEINRLHYTDGSRQWGAGGVLVTVGASTTAGPPHVVSDGNRGAWVAWRDNGSAPGIHVQRFDHAGVTMLPLGGELISILDVDNTDGRTDLDVAVTPSGKLIVAWWDGGLRLQRVSLDGSVGWGGGAGTLCTSDAGPRRLDVMEDGEGAVVVWESVRAGLSGSPSILANRVSSTGAVQWGAEGALVFSYSSADPSMTHADWDGTSLFVSWAHEDAVSRPGFRDVHAQKLDSSGAQQWGPDGISVLLAPDTPWDLQPSPATLDPQIAADGSGGCFVAWVDGRNWSRSNHYNDLYGQRLQSLGAFLWNANGAALDSTDGMQGQPRLLGKGSSLYIAYMDDFGGIRAKGFNGLQQLIFNRNVAEFISGGGPTGPVVAADGSTGLLIAWNDQRNNPPDGQDCYATHLGSNGTFFSPTFNLASPNQFAVWQVGENDAISWQSNLGGNVKLEYRVGNGAQTLISASTPNDGFYSWTVPNTPSTQVKVFISDAADGVPADSSELFTICSLFPSGANVTAGDAPQDIATADFNEDGIEDLVTANNLGGNVSVLLGGGLGGVGNGAFGANNLYAAGTTPRSVAVSDFNDDGMLDLAVTVSTGVRILAGQGSGGVGNGTFGPATNFAAGTNPQGLAVADFNEDGIQDLAVANSSSNNVSILLGQGSGGIGGGTFAPAANYATQTNPSQIAIADFDEDGIWDLAVTNNNNASNSVSVLIGNGTGGHGDGTFDPAVNYAVGNNPRGIVTGDFDDDGITDLAVANNGASADISILLGNGSSGVGDGTFAAATSFAAGTNPWELVVADVDVDRFEDLAVVNKNIDTISLFYGNPIGSFATGPTFATAVSMPYGIVAGDFLEDNHVDLATACSGTDLAYLLDGGCAPILDASVNLTSPDGGEQWTNGSEETIAWSTGLAVIAVNVELSRDGGVNWETLATNLTGNSLVWTVTDPYTAQARVRVHDVNFGARSDMSAADFLILSTTDAPNLGAGQAAFGPAWPNPSAGEIHFTLTVPEAVSADVGVYDLAGRLVHRLARGPAPPGRHTLAWDGRDEQGGRVRPGVYFAVARWPGFEVTRRIVRLR